MKNSYLYKDSDSLQNMIKQKWPQLQQNTDGNSVADTGVMVSQLLCSIADMLAFYNDIQTNEAFLSTAKHPENVYSLCNQLGYQPHGIIPESVYLDFKLDESETRTDNIKIPKETICKTKNGIFFTTINDGYITNEAVKIKAIQGKLYSKEVFWNNELINLENNVAQNSVKISINNIEWKQKEDFIESESNSNHFIISHDHKNTKIIFGDSLHGQIPKYNSKIKISYLETIGEKGNVNANTITEVISKLTHNNNPVKVLVNNSMEASGGINLESPRSAIKNTRLFLKTAYTAVTKEDYENLAITVPDVKMAMLLEKNEYGVLELIIATKNYKNNLAIIKNVETLLNKRKTISTNLKIIPVKYKDIDIKAKVFLWNNSNIENCKTDLLNSLKSFFTIGNFNFGSTVNISEIITLINNNPQVSHVNLLTPIKDIKLNMYQLPKYGRIDLELNYTGE